LGHSLAVSREHYLRPPETMYEIDSPKQDLQAVLDRLNREQIELVQRFAERLLRRASGQIATKIATKSVSGRPR